jgi:predicted membrane protein
MLEVSHFHLFSMGMLIVTLTHLMLMTDFSVRLKIWLSALTYLSALADEAGGWLVRFVNPLFAYFKIAAFLLLEFSLAALLIVVIGALIRARAEMRKSSSK